MLRDDRPLRTSSAAARPRRHDPKERHLPQETPAGWYPAPHANNEPRYWDGLHWHETVLTPGDAPSMPYSNPETEQAAYAQPLGTTQGHPSRKLALAAAILGGAAFFTGLVPVLGLLLAIAAVILAIMALARRQQKGLAVTGLVLGSIALLTGFIVTVVALAGPSTTPTEASAIESTEATSDVSAPADPIEEAPAPEATEPEPAASEAPSESGTVQNPGAQPYVAKGFLGAEKYSLTARVVDANANALVEQWNMFNDEPPAGFKYVVVELSMTGIDPDGVEPSLASYDLSLATLEGNRYDSEYVVFGDTMPSMSDGPTLYPGSAFTGYTAYIVPEAAQAFLLHDNGEYIAL
jgi:hypothetical protein